MIALRAWQYRLSRRLGRAATRAAALLTLGRMPPFVSASVVVEEAGRILVVLDSILGEPILPGGHLKWREDPAAAAVREVREETGLTVTVDRLIGVFAGPEWAGEPGVVRVIYRGRVSGGTIRSSGEGHACWWDASELAASATRDARIVRRALAVRPDRVASV